MDAEAKRIMSARKQALAEGRCVECGKFATTAVCQHCQDRIERNLQRVTESVSRMREGRGEP